METNNENTFLVFGPPGTGKTTYLAGKKSNNVHDRVVGQVEKAVDAYGAASVLVCSFTKAAAVEIGSRVGNMPKRNIGTLHSICYHALECPELTEGHEEEFNKLHCNGYDWALSVHKKRGRGENAAEHSPLDETFDEHESHGGDRRREQIDLLRMRKVKFSEWPDNIKPFHEAWTKWKTDAGLVDFTDLLEKCLADFDTAPGNPAAIFYDEAQDASQIQADLLAQWGKNTRRLVLAGDDDQAIFFWAGADAKSFLDFPCPKENRRYLRQSYRVPKSVHEVSLSWVKQIKHREEKEYLPREEEGFVDHSPAQWKRPEDAIDLAEQYADSGKTVMLIVSCSYMLEPIKAVLRKRGLPFHNPWRRKRGDWNPLLSGGAEKTMPVDRMRSFLRPHHEAWEEFSSGMWQWRDVSAWASPMESKRSLIRGAKEQLKEWKNDSNQIDPPALALILQDKLLSEWYDLRFDTKEHAIDSLNWWIDNLPEKEGDKLEYPRRVFERGGGSALREQPKIIIGTGHSLKGAEADVCFVFPDLSRAGWDSWTCGSVEEYQGIIRLFYVMLTRAKQGVVLCSPTTSQALDLLVA